ncbi:hypothetical protein M406DRAFT_61092 [Cryphonectria parasitica EP155]|uniref:Enoyl reductase (ER) domain-containing protein n=1 Tax=Cryphonectria parasitica (strain ATCC 38755 / EP155) TaxID=660469 RepID=A0A9P4Y627_CRYP1|nr:uncharacterized protein M406DRAFT_61092 [Cryphonectria parasitica EP155]KAF3767037.1 hypothetical protein M406DRAFT_61092 [Cryphonectria parasitica EP155]
MAANNAAYLVATKQPLEVKPAPVPVPKEDEVLIKTKAIAFNPVDVGLQKLGPDVFKWLTLPTILGFDVAGEVEAVGPGVTRFKIGDRVAGLADGGCQEHVPLSEHLTALVPDSVSWEEAATLPMGVSVSTKMLFHKDMLGMSLPSPKADPRGETVLIWGGSTSIGSCAIQLAVAAGYEVITTASSHNFDYIKKLGANQAFDYNSPTVKEDLIAAFKGKTIAGAVANGSHAAEKGPEIVEICAEVVKSCPGKKFVAMTMVPSWGPSYEGVQLKFSEALRGDKELASTIFHGYLPAAIEAGLFKPMPPVEVVGNGLDACQKGIDTLTKGVSAKKIIVTM